MTAAQLARRSAPWLVGVAIVGVLLARIPFTAFTTALGVGHHVRLAAATAGLAVGVLATDSLSTWLSLRTLGVRWPLGRTFAIRGATVLLSIVNYAASQAGLGYYLHRSGLPPARAGGATLFLMGTTFAALLVLAAASWLVAETSGAMLTLLLAGCAAFALYLVIIAIAPPRLARRGLLAPLFETGVRGHAAAVFYRAPHVAGLVLAYWAAMRAWGIAVPLLAAVTLMPAVVVASVLPISPSGLGTSQAAMVFCFSAYARGATADARSADVIAFGTAYFAYGLAVTFLIGIACLPFAKRATDALAHPASRAGDPPDRLDAPRPRS